MNRRSPRRAASTAFVIVLMVVLFALLAALGYGYTLYDKANTDRDVATKDKAAALAQVDNLGKSVKNLEGRIKELESRPSAPPEKGPAEKGPATGSGFEKLEAREK